MLLRHSSGLLGAISGSKTSHYKKDSLLFFTFLRDPSAITQNNAIVFIFLLVHTVRFYSSVTFSKSLFVPYFTVIYTLSLLETLNG
jgi:hypothetical protein